MITVHTVRLADAHPSGGALVWSVCLIVYGGQSKAAQIAKA